VIFTVNNLVSWLAWPRKERKTTTWARELELQGLEGFKHLKLTLALTWKRSRGGETYFISQKYRPLYTLFMNSIFTNALSHNPSHRLSHRSISNQ
jgi:hypothetical protein